MSFNIPIILISIVTGFIITRHNVGDKEFIAIGSRFEKNICHLNLPDCEGTIIKYNWIVTAAHCAIEIKEKLDAKTPHSVIIMDDHYLVDRVIIHEKWSKDGAYDIALLHLKTRASNSEPVDIYTGDNELNKLVYLVGRGDFGNGKKGVMGNDGKLRGATNRVDEATGYWLKWTFDDPDAFPEKATKYEGISGPGDSGGPAFIVEESKKYLVGISSAQSTRASNGIEGVYGVKEYYVRVSRYKDWIKEHLRL